MQKNMPAENYPLKGYGRICPFTISCLQDNEEIINELSYRV